MKRYVIPAILGVVVACAATAWFVVRRSALPTTGAPTAAGAAQTPPAASPRDEAVALLPDANGIEDIEEVSDGIYWIRQRFANRIEEPKQEIDRMWIANTKTKSLAPLGELTSGYPGATVLTTESERYFTVAWESGWDGFFTNRRDVIDRSSGVLAYRIVSKNDREIWIEHGAETIRVQLAPADGCASDAGTGSAPRIAVAGLLVNGDLIPLPAPQTVACIRNDMAGESFYPSFGKVEFMESENTFRIGLPWGGAFTIPADTLDDNRFFFGF